MKYIFVKHKQRYNAVLNKTLLLLGILSSLAGCGFTLRGVSHLGTNFPYLYIQSEQPTEPFHRLLIRTLKGNGIQVIPDPAAQKKHISIATLNIQSIQFNEYATALGADAQSSRVTMQLIIHYQFHDCHHQCEMPNGLIQVSRHFGVNPNAVLSTDNEKQHIKNELMNDAVTQLLRQLSAL